MSTSFAGTAYVANLNSEQRKNDKRNEILLRDIADAPLFGVLRKRGQMKKAGDYKPFWWEDHPLLYKGTLYGEALGVAAALAASATTFYITNASTLLTSRDVLYIEHYQENNSNDTRLFNGEICPIVSIDGNVVTVERNNGSGTATYNVSTALSTDGLTFVNLGACNPEGAGVGTALGHNIENKYGIISYYERVWSITKELMKTDHYGKPERERRKDLALRAIQRDIDQSFCFDQLSAAKTLNAIARPMTQGARDRIATADTDAGTTVWSAATDLVTSAAATSRIWNVQGGFTPTNMKKFIVMAAENVNGKRLLGLHGKLFLPEYETLYDGQIRYDKVDMKDPGLTVLSHTSNGVVIDFVHWPALDSAGLYRDLVTLDMDNLNIIYFDDIYHEDIPPVGAQVESGHYLARMGLQMKNALSHSMLTNMLTST